MTTSFRGGGAGAFFRSWIGEAGADLYADRGGPLVPAAVTAATDSKADIADVHISEPSLENLFLHHTGRSLRD